MIRTYSQIIGNPVLREGDGEPAALLQDIIIHPDTGKIEGFWVKSLILPVNNAVIPSESILEWKKNVYIKDEREIAEPGDIIKITEILSRDTLFMGNQVKNEAGLYLGHVFDLDFDTEKLYLRNMYTQKSFFIFKYDQRLFNYDTIIQVTPDYIVVQELESKKEKVKNTSILKDEQPVMDA
ncbi:hypothetical protein JW752_03470 [Candidatus Peregrinibacteria bacterium]|nr:hypothetical protein [Candidatus Peregrinibacteria bacterium]